MNLAENLAIAGMLENPNGHMPEGRPRFIIRNAADALKPQPPVEYLVTGLITTSTVSMFFGEPGSKKTYSLLSLAVCAAAGKDWMDFTIPEPVKVLIIDEESGERRMAARLSACLRGEIATDIDPTYITYVSLAAFDLGKEAEAKQVSKLIMDVGAQIVIFDALADLMSGDENSKQDTQPVFNHLRKIAEDTDSALILIHHSNKMGAYRGTSAIKGSLDLQVKVESENESKFINFTTEKNRDGEPLKWAAEATWASNEDGDQFYLTGTERKEKGISLTPPRIYVLKYLLAHGESNMNDIKSSVDSCSEESAKAAVYYLTGLKIPYTKRTNPGTSGGAGVKATYDLTIAGKKEANEL